MTAVEARAKAEIQINLEIDREYQSVMQKIENDLKKFHTSVDRISESLKARLQKDGYSVELVQTGINEYEYKISW